ncbi:hypothetical protein [Streptococcus hyointestinalis]|uniref:hypothetical protein n=1 Tax=Streptococcus hyointestinalis TaxID=1337 RepID=UPI00197EC328|nr:hypothetical protein [Streptococcus hyointestinalis]
MSRKSFNVVMTAGFVIFAILAIAADWNYRISLMGLGTLLVLLTLGNALYYHSDKKHRLNHTSRSVCHLSFY